MPSARGTAFRSALSTGCSFSYLRFRFCDLCSSRWLFHEAVRISLPVLLTLMRFAIPLRVLILGTGCGLLDGGLAGGRQDHEQVLALEQRLPLDHRERARVIGDPIEDLPADVLVHHLATSEHDRDLHLLSGLEELLQPFELRLKVVLRHLWAQLHLFLLDDVLLPPLVLLALDGLELVASVVHQAADRRTGLRRHLDEVEPLLVRDAQRGVELNQAWLVFR